MPLHISSEHARWQETRLITPKHSQSSFKISLTVFFARIALVSTICCAKDGAVKQDGIVRCDDNVNVMALKT